MNKYWIFLFALVVLAACTREEIVYVKDNQAPPDQAVPLVLVENYINKTYIALLGRKPGVIEFNQALSALSSAQMSHEAREAFVSPLFEQPAYALRAYDLTRADLLNSEDSTLFSFYLYFLYIQRDTATNPLLLDYVERQIVRHQAGQQIPSQLINKEIPLSEVHLRCVNNNLYDELNMGTENFVVSLFQKFLFRYPTSDDVSGNELNQAKLMVDGFPSSIFGRSGASKDDFLQIFFQTDAYLEGQVIDLYRRYLYRNPTTEEMAHGTMLFKTTQSYQALQTYLLTLNEYIGL